MAANSYKKIAKSLFAAYRWQSPPEGLTPTTPEARRVVNLAQGATPLDFAYHVHTEVGHRCRGAKVNGHIVPLNYQLQNGEQVEILTGTRTKRAFVDRGYRGHGVEGTAVFVSGQRRGMTPALRRDLRRGLAVLARSGTAITGLTSTSNESHHACRRRDQACAQLTDAR